MNGINYLHYPFFILKLKNIFLLTMLVLLNKNKVIKNIKILEVNIQTFLP